MRHLVPFRIYESQTTSGLTKKQETFLNRYTQGTWSVNPTTGLVDIQGDFFPDHDGLKNFLGIEFGNVTGNFACYGNKLQSLEGAPQKVGGDFDCSYNELQSLEGAPQKVDGKFNCSRNKLQSLAGAPQKVDGGFYCYYNQLQSLEGAPQKVVGRFACYGNKLRSLEGSPKEINGKFQCDEFELEVGEWNIQGWLEVLQNGSGEAKKLILTLPIFNTTYWNSKISQNPESTILELSEFWDDMPDEFRNLIRIPPDLKDDFDNLLELVRSGIM